MPMLKALEQQSYHICYDWLPEADESIVRKLVSNPMSWRSVSSAFCTNAKLPCLTAIAITMWSDEFMKV